MFEEKHLFPTTIYSTHLELDNKKLEDLCIDHSNKYEGNQVSNRGGYQSKDLHSKEFEYFYEKISDSVNQWFKQVGFVEHMHPKVTNFWLNINSGSDYNTLHKHGSAHFSWCYYVKTPINSESRIVFTDTRTIQEFVISPNMLSDNISENMIRSFEYEPYDGDLLIFPAWCPHKVTPSNVDENRISIAGNITLYFK
jgi:uncharacterized protein (TIGR02466 family)